MLARGLLRRPLVAPIMVGLALAAIFVVGALIFRLIPALAGLTGYFLRSSLNPAPPGLPTLRPFQRAQGDAALEWLRKRL